MFRHLPDGEHLHIGTGFVIAAMGRHAIVITAAHVLADVIDRATPRKSRFLFPDGSKEPMSAIAGDEYQHLVVFKSDQQTFIAEVTHAWGCKKSDLAVLCVDIPAAVDGLITQQFAINSAGPSVGDNVNIHGYFEIQDISAEMVPSGFGPLLRHLSGGDLPVFAEGKQSSLSGRVVERFPEGVALVRSACFRVDQAFNSGMSGGPVIHWVGGVPAVCGLISLDDSDDAYGTGKWAIASELANLLDMDLMINGQHPLTYNRSDIPPTPIHCLRDLVRLGVIRDLGSA